MCIRDSSTNQPMECLRTVQKMRFKSDDAIVRDNTPPWEEPAQDERLVFFDVEVYPNLAVVCWKYQGEEHVSRMINPTPQEIEPLFKYKLVGFNNRRYDNHILWAIFMGYN